MQDEDEKVEVNFDTFKNLMIHYGGFKAIFIYQILCCLERYIGERNTYNIGIWTSNAELQHTQFDKFFKLLLGAVALQGVIIALKHFLKNLSGLEAYSAVQKNMIKRVLSAPINLYFDVVSTGSVRNRVLHDTGCLRHIHGFLDWVNGMILEIFKAFTIILITDW